MADVNAGLFAVIGILMAVQHRDRTGAGQYVDVSMFDSHDLRHEFELHGVFGFGPCPCPARFKLSHGRALPHFLAGSALTTNWPGATVPAIPAEPGLKTSTMSASKSHLLLITAAGLVVVFALEMWLAVRHQSQTFDESAHIYSGLEYWQRGDFGVNPEHPPLVKLLATVPLLRLDLKPLDPPDIFFRFATGPGGLQLLYSHDADKLLFRSRVAASLFALVLAILIFAAGREMFEAPVGLLALLIFVFEPNILANGALVTTDLGATCGIFAAIYTFYRYAKRPTIARLIVCGVVTGLALATKHSALVIFPLLVLLALSEVFLRGPAAESPASVPAGRRFGRWAGAVVAIGAIAVVVLWSFYGFRYKARPGTLSINPPLAAYAQANGHPWQARATVALSRSHLLPEAYVFGLADVEIISEQGRPMFILGKIYPNGRWFYFPLALLIKCTLGFLVLLGLLILAKKTCGASRKGKRFCISRFPRWCIS